MTTHSISRWTRLLIAAALVLWGCPDEASLPPSDEVGVGVIGDGSDADARAGEEDGAEVGADASTDGAVGPDAEVVAGDGDGTTDVDDGPPPLGAFIRFEAPADGDTITGTTAIRVVPAVEDELTLDGLTVLANGEPIFFDTKAPTTLFLDTRALPPGPLELRVEGQKGVDDGADQIVVTPVNPDFAFSRVTVASPIAQNGQLVSIVVDVEGAAAVALDADFANLDTGYVGGSASSYQIGASTWVITYAVTYVNMRPDGFYKVPISATFGASTLTYDHLELELRNKPPIPLTPQGGIYVSGSMPLPSAGWGAGPPNAVADNTVIVTGGSSTLTIDVGGAPYPDEIVGVLIGTETHAGYYQVPLDGTATALEVPVLMQTYLPGEVSPNSVSLRVAMRDVRGQISQRATILFAVENVGNGDVQVSLSWDTPTDLDLHVVEPTGCELYYANKWCSSGGELDLDSNAGCGIDNVNVENVFWPEGAAPTGTFIVRVDFYSDCCNCGAEYAVTMNYCGKTEIVTDKFTPNSDDFGGAGSGVTVATFSNTNCQNMIRGTVRYEDRAFDEKGFSAWTMRASRYAVVDLVRLSDGAVLGTGVTDREGRYEIRFTNEGPPGLMVIVKAQTDPGDGLRDITVRRHPKVPIVYEVASVPVIDGGAASVLIQDIEITEDQGAGAFNILDVLIDASDRVRRMTGTSLGSINAYWATGADTTETLYCSQYFYDAGVCTELGALSVQGKDTDRDEYDDMVIGKEFFKLTLDRLTRDDNPGGTDDGTRGAPTRAWSEAVSTFFACDVRGSRWFVNSLPHDVYVVDDLEVMDTPFAFGTDPATMVGLLSRHLVSSVLWDLADSGGDELIDGVQGQFTAIYDTVFNALSRSTWYDRGAEGIDLVDFLDGWFCRGWALHGQIQNLVNVHREFPYDFATIPDCTHD